METNRRELACSLSKPSCHKWAFASSARNLSNREPGEVEATMETLLSGPALIGDASPAPGRLLRAHGTLRSASSPRVSPHGSVFIPSTLNTRHSPQNRLEHIPSVQPTALSCGRPAEILGFPPPPPAGPWGVALGRGKATTGRAGEALVSGGVSSPRSSRWCKTGKRKTHGFAPPLARRCLQGIRLEAQGAGSASAVRDQGLG